MYVVVYHIQRIGCQPEKTTLHTVAKYVCMYVCIYRSLAKGKEDRRIENRFSGDIIMGEIYRYKTVLVLVPTTTSLQQYCL